MSFTLSQLFGVTLMLAAMISATSSSMQTFGTGRSQIYISSTDEFVLLNHSLSSSGASHGSLTFFWITGDPIGQGPSSGVDGCLWRFYVDGEAIASVGPLPTAQAALIGGQDPSAPWNNDYFGKNSKFGGWHFNLLVPFQSSIRVTLQMPPGGVITNQRAFAMARGVENLAPLTMGNIHIPTTARLHAIVKTSLSLPVLSFHTLAEVPGQGAVLGTMIDFTSADRGSLNSLEGCWHVYGFPKIDPYPGLVLGTGGEDYPESAFYFNAGLYRGPTSGLTVMQPGNTAMPNSHVSFYKLHHQDPLMFSQGFTLEWRNGDITDPVSGEKCVREDGEPIGSPG